MNKRMRELIAQIKEKTEKAQNFTTGDTKDISKATALLDEVEELQKEYAVEKRLFDIQKNKAQKDFDNDNNGSKTPIEKEFASAVKAIALHKTMTEGINEDGGYTVPVDISTQINNFKEAGFDFSNYISEETVTSNTGRRIYQTKVQATGFTKVAEVGDTTEVTAPSFTKVDYVISDKTGYIPVSKDLLDDSSENITSTIVNWFGKNKVATVNKNVLELISKAEKDKKIAGKSISNFVDFKEIINVTLGSAYKGSIKIYTNDSGYNFFDNITDKNGRSLLNDDMTITIGGEKIEIVNVPSSIWANIQSEDNADTAIPFIVGDMMEAVKRYKRKDLEIASSDSAVVEGFNAFLNRGAVIAGYMRDDYQIVDDKAVVYATMAIE